MGRIAPADQVDDGAQEQERPKARPLKIKARPNGLSHSRHCGVQLEAAGAVSPRPFGHRASSSRGRGMDAAEMRAGLSVILLALALAACSPRDEHWHATDIAGAMPPLAFRMQRANDGTTVTEDSYRGYVVALYFGYTRCPDICPATLANLSDALERLGARARDVRVLF